jgi:hypothetical protein
MGWQWQRRVAFAHSIKAARGVFWDKPQSEVCGYEVEVKRGRVINASEDGYDCNFIHGKCSVCGARVMTKRRRVICECNALLRVEGKNQYNEDDVLARQYEYMNR